MSNLLKLNARCSNGIDHGIGTTAWMYPPVHRLLGWASRPSKLSLKRSVWRLDQIKAITDKDLFVKGVPAESDQATINRFPTLLEASLLSKQSEKIANIADLVFDTKTGNIIYYLVARSNPKLPGTSRWRFDLDKIIDQQPGCVFSTLETLDELPLVKSSIKEDFLKRSKEIRENVLEFSNIANERLEGWLDENQFDNPINTNDNWVDDYSNNRINDDEYYNSSDYERSKNVFNNGEDPWI
ncbi:MULTISPECIES: PRC-barrel domain containing protein [Prochlorococcus]|uniref:PRC-barrel domain containing protein n=1 Tax=Prochlorococcus TaxID=1218 RepID=UPI000A557617|nr:PRC-barrel domain containing protein [Prochlorococcus marinus]